MLVRDTPFGPSPCRGEGARHPVAGDRFHLWFGSSGIRYMTSVFAADPAGDDDLPDFGPAVLFAVARRAGRRVILGVRAVEREGDWRHALAAWRGAAVEWHIHLLARDRAARTAVVADFAAMRLAQAA